MLEKEFMSQIAETVIEKLSKKGFIQKPMPESKSYKLLTAKEAASFYSVHINTIRSWAKDGVVKSKKIGNRIYILKEEL